jgi:exodeoxyribonuclease V alpha subunit
LPIGELKAAAGKLLEVGEDTVGQALSQMITSGSLILETVREEALVFLPHLRKAEEGIGAAIRCMAGTQPAYPPIDFDKAVTWCEQKTGKRLAPSQREALRTVLASRVVIITGGPGVGKTTLLHSILIILRAKGVQCLLCAPTGRAAKRLSEATNMEAKTIHRLLEVEPATGRFARNESHRLEGDVVVMDETSMVDVMLMHSLLKAMPLRSSLILVGDVDQLPSVGPGNVLRNLIDCGLVPVVRLTEVFRQAAGSQIIMTAHRIRRGLLPETTRIVESDFHFIEREEPEQMVGTLEDMVRNRIPRKFLFNPVRDVQVLCPMNRGSLGVRELNQRLQRLLNPARPGEPTV